MGVATRLAKVRLKMQKTAKEQYEKWRRDDEESRAHAELDLEIMRHTNEIEFMRHTFGLVE